MLTLMKMMKKKKLQKIKMKLQMTKKKLMKKAVRLKPKMNYDLIIDYMI